MRFKSYLIGNVKLCVEMKNSLLSVGESSAH